jgi:hypothetical protein
MERANHSVGNCLPANIARTCSLLCEAKAADAVSRVAGIISDRDDNDILKLSKLKYVLFEFQVDFSDIRFIIMLF